ncbi:DNA polymerase II large subunit [uncultured archaeon]|nr:DNA polymerase II large subunit [uncultured archaeon]
MTLAASEEYQQYLDSLKGGLDRAYAFASEARKQGFDPSDEVEIKIAKDVAARVEALVGPPGIAKTIRDMEASGISREDIAFQLAARLAGGEIIKGTPEKLIEQAVRTSVGVLTEGMLVAPTEGISKVKIRPNPDGTNYVSVYFTGPIRSAGGTVAALAVTLADYARRIAKVGDYRATDGEIERYAEEVNVYEARAAHLQYKPPDDDVKWIAKNCPVCIDGDPTEDAEVSVYRDLPRVETNRVRGGIPLVICEGIAQKAAKVYKFAKKFNLGWDWLEKLIKIKRKESTVEIKPDWTYLEGLVAGRPVFAYPSTKGGFRLRYGKSRTNGIMAKNMHPATMVLLDDFIAVGTHMKIERPGKGAILSGCDTLEPPIVKLKNGSVMKVRSTENAKELRPQVETVLFLGDMLVPYGDFLKSNHPLVPGGWCEEWWQEECKAKNAAPKKFESAREAFEFSKNYGVPLHPDYVYFWHDIEPQQLKALASWLSGGTPTINAGEMHMLALQLGPEKEILEELGVEHTVADGKIFVNGNDAHALFSTLGLEFSQDGRISSQKL